MCKLIIVLSFFGVIGVSVGQILQDGQCDPNVNLFANFDVEEFLGTWHEIRRTDSPLGGDCSTIEFTRVGDGITVFHKTVRENFYAEYVGNASVEANSSRLTLNLPQASSNPIDFWVINTDYTTFALTYGCQNVGTTQRQVYVWQIGRTTSFPSEMIQANLNMVIQNLFGITPAELRDVSHTEEACFELPLIEAGQPVILSGRCNENITGVANFNAANFLGVWHQVASYYTENAPGSCSRAQYSDGGDRVNVVNSQVINQTLISFEGYATVISTDGTGRLNVVLEVLPGVFAESELLVLATDYERWAITYTCNNLDNNQRRVFSWIASRTRQLPTAAQAEVNTVINSIIELNNQYYETTDQTDASCFYIPEPVLNEPVVFGGQCDMTIPVVTDFQAADYMGLWHEIERYPTSFQFGGCSNAKYAIVDGIVDVYNTQVFNQTLDTLNGQAVPTGTDGKLVVTFPVIGTNLTVDTDYWVISTDYTSYSLVYSCININDYQQQVTVWKLSRAKSLSATSATAINNAMAPITVLNQNYFQTTDQSVEACFYYPEPQPGVPVVFPGQCETNIPVVANFNTTQFQGEWFEVEAYPKDPQGGSCVNHQFSTGTGTAALDFVSSNVDDQLFGTTNGQLTFYAGESGGRFTLSFVSNGITISFPYYVMATDYVSYALVYSCLNISSDFRGIWAWKLSRTKDLSTNANTEITNALASTVVLSNDYFEPVDQSDDACFYFPDLQPGENVILPGQCDTNITAMQNFNVTAYLGRWRLIESYPAKNQDGECNQNILSIGTDGSLVISNNVVTNQTLREISGFATVEQIGGQNTGRLTVTFPDNTTKSFDFNVLDTDYVSYSIAYGCVNEDSQHRRVYSWKLSRTTSLTPEAVVAINAVTSNVLVLNDRYYETVDHSDDACFYYPTPGSGSTIFRGQCDDNITVVTDFDAVAYMGLWHDIESYVVPFQDGSCPNAFYTLDLELGQVDVFNTQVVNQTLDTISGYAVLEPSTDGSAKLLVTFEVLGFSLTTPYWVLDTDYISYAFVYSCTNIDDETRSVSSWKLSRSKSLSTAANTAINSIMNTIPVLDQQYYNVRDQSSEGCFYFPEPQAGVPVRFPGQCDENISVVTNFTLNQFQGQWFEIETYPKDPQPGECINHEFSSGTTNQALNFVSTNVFDQMLGSSYGNVTLYPNQNDGRLTLSVLDSNGTEFSIPYYVIDTDYISYALVYSCLNLDADYRGIWSWKLSRSKQLSTSAVTNINNAMANIDVLSNDYFEPVDQSDDACFYFPDLQPGEPVILPGQCDTNVTAMQNFNASAYLGRWRLIESYPAENQDGECNQNILSIGTDGILVISNNVVTNQTLREISGFATVEQIGDQNTGRLTVTFPSTTESLDLYILDTDYVSYSIAYACENVDSQQRRVYSWKLSRTTSLTPEAVVAINAVTSNVLVLNDRYYETVDHSDDACFYYPTPGSGSIIFRGQCDDNITVVTDFDAVAYMGLWHDIESYVVPFQDGSCPNAFYTLDLELGQVDVFNTQVVNQTLDTISGYAVLEPSTDGSAKLLVTFEVLGFSLTTPYWVLDTDYISYAFVYSCTNIDDETRSVSSWKLSRSKSLSTAANTAINSIMNTIPVLDQQYYNVRDQSSEGCFYFPEPQAGVPVRFPGQCDENISVVTNFTLNQFQGQWFEIETYPKDPQPGECINHEFSSGTTNQALNFVSTNVFDQMLGTSYGNVTLYPNQNDGRLTLSVLDSNGTEFSFPYYVMDTDYISYALVYSCLNLDADYRGIWSWKLSRSKQLSTSAVTNINNAMANIDVLSNDYFEPVDQSDDACFYFPDLQPGEPVILPGQCDTNITAMQNFNATAYLGRWRLIESYPSDNQDGECNQNILSIGTDGTLLISNNVVTNQTLREINGFATVEQIGGQTTGRLTVTFPSTTDTFDFYVLDTDYESYSIAYGCVNVNNEQRRVYSWKLSRTTSLTPQAVAAINAVTSSVLVLNDKYYETVDNSDSACFYFPTPSNDPVIFRGQCDETINVVAGFDAVAYMGTWYNIESYPAPFQDGTCGTATYSLNTATAVVYVENSQVLNQVLDVQTGTAVLVDGTNAKLAVTFEVNGMNITTDYWVLATDYTSYSFVYSCQNINDEYRQVNSFKLSRTRALPAAALSAINAAINNVQVLDQQYFVEEGHSDDDCFFYPDNNGGDVILDGQCVPDDQVPAVTGFNVNSFAGTWHEVSRFPSDLQEGECAANTFSVGAENSVTITQTIVDDEFQTASVISGTFSNDGRGIINATVAGLPFNFFFVLATDYSEYAVVYGCRELENNTKQIYSWKLARSRSGLSQSANSAVDQVVSTNIDLFEGYYSYTEQTNDACFHYPEFEELPEDIELPGPCDETIQGIPAFNAAAYVGRWIEIERYPQAHQLGVCNRAYYTAGEDNVLVRNTQVIGNSLLERLGSAVVASNDGSALLNVTFNVNGVDVYANYYVMATDYTSYALVYSCRNTDNNTRLVSSWKLSRTTSLTAQADAAMEAIINQTQGLSQQYYQTTSQTEEACFYIPELDENTAPLFRGQCEAVSGVTNFNSQAFLGWWHEMKRYAVDSNIGECISSHYTSSNNAIQVVDTSVASGSADVVTGTVVMSADGRLTRWLINGVQQEIVVLATDYNNYAVLYSCEDVQIDGEAYRRVWSAKHSKRRELTAADEAAMAPVIESNSVLHEGLYLNVVQTDAACFHYPEIDGQRVILPGQCDDNIPVVANFDVAAYGGMWYQMERYPQVHENPTSTCIGARYVLDAEAGEVSVLNWEVIDGVLETIEGVATVASTDGSAKLSVVLPIVGTNDTVTTSLYVLTTDYEDFSLAYSCSNINDFQRSIGTWKLSRSRTLSAEGERAIQAYMANREELDDRYYLKVEQSEDCEEPSAGALVKSSFIVILVCAVIQLLY